VWGISFLGSLFIFWGGGLCISFLLYDYKLEVAKKVLWERSVYVTLEIKVESMEVSCILILTMENGWKYIVLFYLEDVR